MAKIDFSEIKKEYLTTNKSLEELAEEFHVNTPSYLREVASKENWVAQREKTRQEVNKKSTEKLIESLSDINLRHANIWKVLQGESMQKIVKFRDNKQEVPQDILRDLASVLKISVEGERVAVGLPITVTKGEMTGIIRDEYEQKLRSMSKDELLREISGTVQRIKETRDRMEKEKPVNVDSG